MADVTTLQRPATVEGPSRAPVAVVRTRELEPGQIQALGRAFALEWPDAPNRVAGEDFTVLWTGPSEWTVIGLAPARVDELAAKALGPALRHVADVSDGRAVFTVGGPGARTLLAHGCGLDLHPRAFGPEACAQTLLGQVDTLVYRLGDGFKLLVDASLAAHLRAWFAAAQRLAA